MEKTIYKYQLRKTGESIEMPEGAQVLTVQVQNGDPQLWALVDPNAKMVTRVFRFYGTGHVVPDDLLYIGTFQLTGGRSVFHVFEDIQMGGKRLPAETL